VIRSAAELGVTFLQHPSRPHMTKPGQKQRATLHKVAANVSPDDVRYLEIQRDERLRADHRTEAEKYFGDPDYARSALAEYRQRQAQHSRTSSDSAAAEPSGPHGAPRKA
jgi:hypothetical protein